MVQRIGKRSASCLPPIATFSQKCVESHKLVEATVRSNRTIRKRYARRREFYCTWSTCPRALRKIPFSYKCRLKCHMRLHLNRRRYRCPDCNLSFNTTLNWKRHQTVHQESKKYECPVCGKRFSRSSEWSRCRKHHRLLEEVKMGQQKQQQQQMHVSGQSRTDNSNWSIRDQSITSSLPSGSVASSIKNATSTSFKLRPYKCPVCSRTRSYTDPGSLRKHMRLYHPDYKTKQIPLNPRTCAPTTGEQANVPCDRVQSELTSTVSMVQLLLIPVETAQKARRTSSSDPPMVTVPYYCPDQFAMDPVWFRGSSQQLVGTDDPQHCSDDSRAPVTQCLFTQHSSSNSTAFQSVTRTVQQVHGLDAQCLAVQSKRQVVEEDDDTRRWNVPVDLCNSALCLQTIPDKVTDFPICAISPEKLTVPSSQLEAENSDLVTFLGDSDLLNQNAALDLTEPPPYITLPVVNDVIDLSGDANFAFNALDPIDLSAPQPQRKEGGDRTMVAHGSEDVGGPGYSCAKSNHSFGTWDPEPDFSFTDLLTNDFDDPDTVFNYLLSNDLSMHSSPCKTSVPIVSHALTNPTTIMTNPQPPPLDLRLPHAPMFSF